MPSTPDIEIPFRMPGDRMSEDPPSYSRDENPTSVQRPTQNEFVRPHYKIKHEIRREPNDLPPPLTEEAAAAINAIHIKPHDDQTPRRM
tara:strand:- start:339 stop:605 length:267 start_codon:yes stop_codon:yes gene_type:complete